MAIFSLNFLGRSPLGTVPFAVKLFFCVLIDIVSLMISAIAGGSLAIGIMTLVGGVLPASLTSVAVAIGSSFVIAVIQGLVAFLFWTTPVLIGACFFSEVIPYVNAVPIMTIICLWNGYKTGFKY